MHGTRMTRPRPIALLDALCAPSPDPHSMPLTVIVCAHPDDEVIGAGGRLPHLREVSIVHVTDGGPRTSDDATARGFRTRGAYVHARAAERARALALAGVRAEQLHDVGLVDQEASSALVALTLHMTELLDTLRPELVLTHAYEGGHPDHDASAFAVHAAVRRLRVRYGMAPTLVEMTSYHARGAEMAVGEFLPSPNESEPRLVALCDEEQALKRRMFACYATQQRVLAAFPADVERFRLAPAYDFTMPPHAGQLFYERFAWGCTGERWRGHARHAIRALEIAAEEVPC